MAHEGTCNTNQGWYGSYFHFSWTSTQNIAANKTTINWSMTLQGSQVDVFTRGVKVQDTQYGYGEPFSWNWPQDNHVIGWVAYSGSTDIYHKTDGTASFTVLMQGNLGISYPGNGGFNVTGSQTWELDRIPRNAPSITSKTINNTTYADKVVAGYSTSTFNIVANANNEGATINRYVIKQGSSVLYDGNRNNPSIKVPSISGNEASITYSVTVYDSYGFSKTENCTAFTAYKYTAGKFTSSPLSQRCNADGTLNEEGTYAKCQISFQKSTIGGSEIATTAKVAINSYNDTSQSSPLSKVIGSGNLSQGSSYGVIYSLSDIINTSFVTSTDIISVSFHTMNFSPDGKGVGIGQAGVSGYFDANNMIPRFGGGKQEFNINDNGQLILRDVRTNSTNGSMFVGWGTGHKNHGLYSDGYAPTTTTWTGDPKWMIYRNDAGEIIVNGTANRALTADSISGGVTTYTNKVSKSSGQCSIGSQSLSVFGKIATLYLQLNFSADTGNNATVFSGTIADYHPATRAQFTANWAEWIFECSVDTSGNISVVSRTGGYTVATSGSNIKIGCTFVCS